MCVCASLLLLLLFTNVSCAFFSLSFSLVYFQEKLFRQVQHLVLFHISGWYWMVSVSKVSQKGFFFFYLQSRSLVIRFLQWTIDAIFTGILKCFFLLEEKENEVLIMIVALITSGIDLLANLSSQHVRSFLNFFFPFCSMSIDLKVYSHTSNIEEVYFEERERERNFFRYRRCVDVWRRLVKKWAIDFRNMWWKKRLFRLPCGINRENYFDNMHQISTREKTMSIDEHTRLRVILFDCMQRGQDSFIDIGHFAYSK